MAPLVTTTYIDRLLDQLTATWSEIPEVAAEFPGWDLGERLNYTEEWPLYEDKLFQLHKFIKQGLLTAAQQERYAELSELMERNRPLRDQVLR